GRGLQAGVAIVILAIVIDRISQAYGQPARHRQRQARRRLRQVRAVEDDSAPDSAVRATDESALVRADASTGAENGARPDAGAGMDSGDESLRDSATALESEQAAAPADVDIDIQNVYK